MFVDCEGQEQGRAKDTGGSENCGQKARTQRQQLSGNYNHYKLCEYLGILNPFYYEHFLINLVNHNFNCQVKGPSLLLKETKLNFFRLK